MIKNIAFDVGGVLLNIATSEDVKSGFVEFLQNEIKVNESPERIQQIVNECVGPWFAEIDTGLNLWNRYFSPEISSQIVERYKYFHANRYQPIPSMMSLVKKLSDNYAVGILSNFSADFVLGDNFYGQSLFNPVIFSGVVGVKKPDPRIYQLYSQRAGCSLPEILFIDDNWDNVASAVNLGMTAFQFTTQSVLESDLKSVGITL